MQDARLAGLLLAAFAGLYGCSPRKQPAAKLTQAQLFDFKDKCSRDAAEFEKSWPPQDPKFLNMVDFTNHYDPDKNACYVQRSGTIIMTATSETVRDVYDAQEGRLLYSCSAFWKKLPGENAPSCTAHVQGVSDSPEFKRANAAMDKLMGYPYGWPAN
jgi:hypothetical protein